jgi:hypothetical protein
MSDLCIHSHRESSHRNHIAVIASDDVFIVRTNEISA